MVTCSTTTGQVIEDHGPTRHVRPLPRVSACPWSLPTRVEFDREIESNLPCLKEVISGFLEEVLVDLLERIELLRHDTTIVFNHESS